MLTFVAIAIVSYATILYSHNPVDNTQKPDVKVSPEQKGHAGV
jgi:hypothetical protein